MKRTSKTKRPISAESIARLADEGENISSYFTNKGIMMPALETERSDLSKNQPGEFEVAAQTLDKLPKMYSETTCFTGKNSASFWRVILREILTC
jgi:hypothetical protein